MRNHSRPVRTPVVESLEARINLSAMHAVGYDWGGSHSTTVVPTNDPTYTSVVSAVSSMNNANNSNNSSSGGSTGAVAVSVRTMNHGGFQELVVTGTTGNDSIVVSQSGNTLTVTGNGHTNAFTGTFGDLVVKGVGGTDNITVDSSVSLPTILYAGGSGSSLKNLTRGKATIVSVGTKYTAMAGNGVNTSYWADPTDTVYATAAETAGGFVHKIGSFANGVGTTLNSPYIANPVDAGNTSTASNMSLFGTGAVETDVNQGNIGDCYFLAPLASIAHTHPGILQNLAVDLGDGTYAVEFQKNGGTVDVRVNNQFSTGGYAGYEYAHPTGTGNLWAAVFEKAYAFDRTGANSYGSIGLGWAGDTYTALGQSSFGLGLYNSAATLFSQLQSAAYGGHAVTFCSNGSISGAPIVTSHCYSLETAYVDSTGTARVVLRNPWGFDGAGNDGNPNDGLITLTMAQVQQNFNAVVQST